MAFVLLAACGTGSSSSSARFDAWSVDGPSALINGTDLKVWYYGASTVQDHNVDLGLSTGSCTASPCVPGTLARSGAVRTSSSKALSVSTIASDPSVFLDGTLYRMWFTSVDSNSSVATAYTTSTDGTVWDTPTYSVLSASDGTFDAAGIDTPYVLSVGGQLKLFYTGTGATDANGGTHQSIGLAVSTDGITWSKVGTTPVLDSLNQWETGICIDAPTCSEITGGVGEPTVVFDTGTNLYRMWYSALGTLNSVDTYRIGYATSPDGVTWSRQSSPNFVAGATGAWDDGGVSQPNVVADPAGGFHLFYFGFPSSAPTTCSDAGGCAFIPGSLGHAFSTDGVTWVRDANPVLKPS